MNTQYIQVHKHYAQDTRFGQHETGGGWSRGLPEIVSMHTHMDRLSDQNIICGCVHS